MGRSTTPKYALDIFETRLVNGRWQRVKVSSVESWDTKSYGRPTAANVEKFALAYGKSMEPGGVNAHLSEGLGYIPYPTRVVVRHNVLNGAAVAEWNVPNFFVW